MSIIKANVIFCEDIRHERSGSNSAMGIYPGYIRLKSGTGLERLSVLVMLYEGKAPIPDKFTVSVEGSDGNKIEAEVVAEGESEPNATGLISMVLGKIPVPEDGLEIKVYIIVGSKKHKIGILKISRI